MKSRFILAASVALLSFSGFSADTKSTGNPQTLTGYLVDLACANENGKKPDPKFATTHDKSCLQMEECVKSGYAVLTPDNKIVKFDSKGNEQAKKFIEMTNRVKDWKVTVSGPVQGNTIAVNSLMLQK